MSHVTLSMLSPFSQSKSFLKTGIANPLDGSGMIKYEMTALMRKVMKLRRSCHLHGMLKRMFQRKTGTDYLRTVTAVTTLMVFNFLLCDCNE